MYGNKYNSIKMNKVRKLIYFGVIFLFPFFVGSYKKNESYIQFPSNDEIYQINNIVRRTSNNANQEMFESENNLKQKLYSKSNTEIIDISKEKNVINFGEKNKNLFFVSTLDGYLHAIDSENNELWKISLGNSLVNSFLNNNNIFEQNNIIPDMDGNIYLHSMQNNNKLTKIDIPIKTLIDSSPFTLPNIPNTIFLGDKKSSIFTIDIEKGLVISKSSNSGSLGYINQKPIQTNNLLTVIRTDYTLSSYNQIIGSQSWNITVSEVMAIQKGSRNEIAVNWKSENSNYLSEKISKLLEKQNLDSIVSIHNYIPDSNLPIKIFDNKKTFNSDSEIDFENFLNSNKDKFFKNYEQTFFDEITKNNQQTPEDASTNTNNKNALVNFIDRYPNFMHDGYGFDNKERNIKINISEIFKEYLNFTRYKLQKDWRILKHNGIISGIFFKLKEFYYFNGFFIVSLIAIILLLIFVNIKFYLKNNRLKDKLKLRKKSSESSEESNKGSENNHITHEGRNCHSIKSKEAIIDDIKNNVTCINTEYGPICVYVENKNIQTFQKLLNEKINIDFKEINKDKDMIFNEPCSNYTWNNNNENSFEVKNIKLYEEAKLNMLGNNKQIKEIFKPQIDLNLKSAEIQNQVESTFSFLKDSDGNFVKIENKQLITKYEDKAEVKERIMQITEQIALIHPQSNNKAEIENKNYLIKHQNTNNNYLNEGLISQYKNYQMKNTIDLYGDCNQNVNYTNKISDRKFTEFIGVNKSNSNYFDFDVKLEKETNKNSQYYSRAKSNNTKKIDFQPIQFSIKALKEKDKTEFTFEKSNLSTLADNNASANSNIFKFEINSSKINTPSKMEDNNKNSTIKPENSLVLVKDLNKDLNKEFNNIKDKNSTNLNLMYKISIKDRSKSKQRKTSNLTSDSNHKDNNREINGVNQKSPNENKTKAKELINNKQTISKDKQVNKCKEISNADKSKINKINKINLKCKYKEYKEFNISNENEKNKLLKIDTTFIDEGRIGKNFEEFSKVGEGGFGSVFKAKHKIDGSLYAIKVIKLDVGISQSLKDHKVIKEVKTMMKLYHKNVVRYYTCWFQLNIEEIKNLKSENDVENHSNNASSAFISNCNVFTRTKAKKRINKDKEYYENSIDESESNNSKKYIRKNRIDKGYLYEDSSEASKSNNSNVYMYNNRNDKIIRKIHFNNAKDKNNFNPNCKYLESIDKSRNNTSYYDESNFNSNSKSKYISKSISRSTTLINYYSTTGKKKNKNTTNQFIDLNATKSKLLNQISENGESDLNSKNQSEVGAAFDWEDSNFITKRNKDESYKKSQNEKFLKRGRSSENSKINISYNGNSFWNQSKSKIDLSEASLKHVRYLENIYITIENKNKDFENSYLNSQNKDITYRNHNLMKNTIDKQNRKLLSLTDENNHDKYLIDKKAFSISLDKNAEEILSDESDFNSKQYNYPSNDESRNTNTTNKIINKNDIKKNSAKNKIRNKNNRAQDDSMIDLTKRNKKKKKEFVYNVYFLVQMEFCDGLSLNQYLEINKANGLNRQTIFSFFKQILSGVNQIHKSNIIHRDLKPHNIFVIGENSLKIGDFGLAYDLENYTRQKKLNNSSNKNTNALSNNLSSGNILNNLDNSFVKIDEFVGTPLYQSPEQLKELAYNEKVDIYAMGLILYELCCCFKTGMERRLTIEKLRNEHKIENKIEVKYEIESELILWMTRPKPSDRPAAQEILISDKFKTWKKQFSD